MANIIETLEQEEIARLGKAIPKFAPGDTVAVGVNVTEGTRKRVQIFEGVVISRRNRGLNSSFIVRKISSGEGIERTFQLHSPIIESIEVTFLFKPFINFKISSPEERGFQIVLASPRRFPRSSNNFFVGFFLLSHKLSKRPTRRASFPSA